jgi:hypothetical protein
MPLVDQELLILSEKMSSPKVLMGFILLDAGYILPKNSLVSNQGSPNQAKFSPYTGVDLRNKFTGQ